MDEKFFVAKITYDLPDENSGKIKKYEGFSHDWRITSVSESKIDEVIE
jgi:hypothetical protein